MLLGGRQFEIKKEHESLSCLEARRIFLEMMPRISPKTILDLVRRYNLTVNPEPFLRKDFDHLRFDAELFHRLMTGVTCDPLIRAYGFDATTLDAPFPNLCRFINKNKAKIKRRRETEIDRLRKDFKTLDPGKEWASKLAAKSLILGRNGWEDRARNPVVRSLHDWGRNWHIHENWCLDFALDVLLSFRFDTKVMIQLDRTSVTDITALDSIAYRLEFNAFTAWSNAHWESKWWTFLPIFHASEEVSIFEEFQFDSKSSEIPEESLTLRIRDVYVPTAMSDELFRKKLETQFWRHFFDVFADCPEYFVGRVTKVSKMISRFEKEVAAYIRKCRRVARKNLRTVVRKLWGERDFGWLIETQIVGKTYSQVALENGVDNKAVSVAARNLARLIGLSVRKMPHTGRKPGIRETHERRRLGDHPK